MKYRVLGKTGWKVSAIGMGCWGIGGQWGTVEEKEAIDTIQRAVELGVNLFDTADAYGTEMGTAKNLSARRSRPIGRRSISRRRSVTGDDGLDTRCPIRTHCISKPVVMRAYIASKPITLISTSATSVDSMTPIFFSKPLRIWCRRERFARMEFQPTPLKCFRGLIEMEIVPHASSTTVF